MLNLEFYYFSFAVCNDFQVGPVAAMSVSVGRVLVSSAFHWFDVDCVWKCDGTRAETRFCLSAKRTSPFKSAGASVQSTTGSRVVSISGSNVRYTVFRGSEGYWLPTPFASFPFTSPPVRHRVPSRFNWTLPRLTEEHDVAITLLGRRYMVRVSTELSMKIFVWFSFSRRVLGCYLQSGSGYLIAVSYIVTINKLAAH